MSLFRENFVNMTAYCADGNIFFNRWNLFRQSVSSLALLAYFEHIDGWTNVGTAPLARQSCFQTDFSERKHLYSNDIIITIIIIIAIL